MSNGTGSYSYQIISGNDENYFSLTGNTIVIKASTPAKTSYSLLIRATDNNSEHTKNIQIELK